MPENDTIVAVATPPGMGGIGVVRISGPEALEIALTSFRPKNKKLDVNTLPARSAVYGSLVDIETYSLLDHCILTWFQSGASYTGEEVVEISCHGSRPILRRAVELFSQGGARLSGPGEFTLRAVLAGRLDLVQAEAINRLIRADTLTQAESAMQQLDGSVSNQVFSLEEDLLNTISAMEAAVDFAEEGESFSRRERVHNNINNIQKQLANVIENFSKADILRDGAVVVIAGRSNAGKSTLFNALLQRERAIVDSQPGTTRDFISEVLDMDGLPVTLYDTAGLRTGGEAVEQEGMRRSEELLLKADLVLHVTVAGEKTHTDDERIAKKLEERNISRIPIVNKADLLQDDYVTDEGILISAISKEGFDILQSTMRKMLQVDELASTKGFVTEKRQQQLFINVHQHVNDAEKALSAEMYDEVILHELNQAMHALSEITGHGGTEEILGRIFSSFCIGK